MTYLGAYIVLGWLITVAPSYLINKKLINKFYIEAARRGYKNILDDRTVYSFFYSVKEEIALTLTPFVNIISSLYHLIFKFNKKERDKLIKESIKNGELTLMTDDDREFFNECPNIRALDLIKDFSKKYEYDESPNSFFRSQDPNVLLEKYKLNQLETKEKEKENEFIASKKIEEIEEKRKNLREMKKDLIRDIMLIIYTEIPNLEKEKQVSSVVDEYCLKLSKHKNLFHDENKKNK